MLTPKRILVAVDMSPCSLSALRYALVLAERFKATVEALYVVQPRAKTLWMGPQGPRPISETGSKHPPRAARREIEAWAAQTASRRQRPPRVRVEIGDPAEVILRCARRGFDLLVMGKAGSAALPGSGDCAAPHCGSVAQRVLREAPCTVLPVWQTGQGLAARPAGLPAAALSGLSNRDVA